MIKGAKSLSRKTEKKGLGRLSESGKCLPRKCEDRIQSLERAPKARHGGALISPVLGSGDRETPGVPWPASLAYLMNWRPMRELVSNIVGRT